MKMPIPEVADRYSISLLKHERIDGINLSEELTIYREELNKYEGISNFIERLYQINGEIWDLEFDIRKGLENELGLEEVGRRALLVRNKNKIRVAIKNEIVEKYKEGFSDIKINHISA